MVRFKRWAVATLLVLTVAGCAAQPPVVSGPGQTETPSPSATPQPGPPATVVIGAASVSVEDAAGAELGTAAYESGADAIVQLLSTALGDPVRSDEDTCGPSTYFLWGGFEGLELAAQPSAEADDAQLRLSSKTPAFEGIAIESTPGIAVGDDVSALVASLPADQYLAENGALVWGKTGTTDTGTEVLPVGGVIYSTDGTATALLAPGNFYSGYSC